MRQIILIATLFIAACSFNPSGVVTDDPDAGASAPDGCGTDAAPVTPDAGATAPDAATATPDAMTASPDAAVTPDAGCGETDAAPADAAPPHVPTITCKVVSAGIEYTITGGIKDHLWSPTGTGTVATPTYIEYGDGYDGWTLPYPAGSPKQKVAYSDDDGTYVFTLSASVDDLNFFLTDTSDTDGSDGAVGGKYFDLAEWSAFVNVTNADGATPNCRLDAGGGGILH